MTNRHVRLAKTEIRLIISLAWPEYLLSSGININRAQIKDSDQTIWMSMLIWVFIEYMETLTHVNLASFFVGHRQTVAYDQGLNCLLTDYST